MKRFHLHLIGLACLIIATALTWSSRKQPVSPIPQPERSTPNHSTRATSTSPRTSQKKPPFFIDSPTFEFSRSSTLLKSHALSDQKSALASTFALPPSSLRDKAIAYLLEHIAKQDPIFAKQQWLAWEYPLTDPWVEVAGHIALALAKDDAFAPYDFITENIPRTSQLKAWETVLWEMDYQAASQVIENSHPSPRLFNIAKSVTNEWMKHDPPATATWLDSFIPTLTEAQRTSSLEAYPAFRRLRNSDPDLFDSRLETFRLAKNPITRDYLARCVLVTEKITPEQKAAFLKELTEKND